MTYASVIPAKAGIQQDKYVPTLNSIFKTEPLDTNELLICLALSSVFFLLLKQKNGWYGVDGYMSNPGFEQPDLCAGLHFP